MTLQAKFDQQLKQLGSGGATTVAVEDAPRQITCEITERDSLAVSFNRLRLGTSELAAAGAASPAWPLASRRRAGSG